MFGCGIPKQHFIAMVHNSNAHNIISWHEISVKLNIRKKITRLEILTLNQKNISIYNITENYRKSYGTDVKGLYNSC